MLAALDHIKAKQDKLLKLWGFSQKSILHPVTNEHISYLEKPASTSSTGKPSRTLLMLHGMTQDSLMFAPFAAALKPPSDVRILIPDAQGHGSRISHAISMGDDYMGWTAEERSTDVAGFLSSVVLDNEEVDVVGYSMGGGTALTLAANHPTKVNRTVLLAPACCVTEEAIKEMGEQGLIRYNYNTAAEAVDMLEYVGFPRSVAEARGPMLMGARAASGVDSEYWATTWQGTINGCVGIGLTIEEAMLEQCADQASVLKAMNKPVLVIQGTHDRVIHDQVPATILKAMGDELCGVTLIKGYGHAGSPSDDQGYIAGPSARPAAAFLGYPTAAPAAQ
jgi:pimeloyl-ACP methyl ester carboxylesterase